jgi:enterobacterial common antigen flippase
MNIISKRTQSYNQILKSSSIVGGAQVVNILVGMIRTKFVSVLLGPAGVGLQGMYSTIISLISTLTSLGINGSGVRDVAQAYGNGDPEHVAKTILTLRRMVWLTGLAGTLILIILAIPIDMYTFKSTEHSLSLMLLSVTLLFGSIAGGHSALIQGVRRIGDLARMTVIGSMAGSIIGISFYYMYGINGIVPAMIVMSLFNMITNWWFAKKIQLAKVIMTWRQIFIHASGLVKLGIALMLSGLVSTFVAYFTKTLVSRQIGLEAVGIFQTAFALAGMFMDFVLQAMGADFYPRLTAASSDHQEMNHIINEQTEIGLLLAVPGLIASIVLAPWIILIFYTDQFLPAVDMMRWFVFGCLGKVISWPMGFILLAKGYGRLFFASEITFGITHIILIWIGLKLFGLLGVAVAFVLLYVLYAIFMLVLSGRLIGFRWNNGVRTLFIFLFPASIIVFVTSLLLSVLTASCIGCFLTIAVSLYCLRQLAARLGPDHRMLKLIQRIPFINLIIPT